ncbi:mechanosensitive ion channel [Aureisphaera galaxeae]|uniref:mechanosensitive ion channel family protein n=1 Tax=Aureisphaera galaxeae TaxID=1538023 RepID=UPI002350F31B|nr:mechanosensitive ion channel [Aureisphaera galaxeae]MDC8003509.1 mechanosensitive ion channel [Aureisphaera galaxeae]
MKDLFNVESLDKLMSQLKEILPLILGALLFFIGSWILLKIILFIVRKSLKIAKIDTLTSRIIENENLFGSSLQFSPSTIILGFVKWFMILVLIILGSDLLGLTMVSQEVGKLVSYLPRIFSAFVILGFGLYLATLAKRSIQGIMKSFDLSGSRIVSALIFYVIVIITGITSLNQAGINTEIITKNLSIILGAILATFTIAMGLGSRDIVTRLILGFYTRKNFTVGQHIKIDGFVGKIESIDNICITLSNGEERKIYPIKMVANKKIEVLNRQEQKKNLE